MATALAVISGAAGAVVPVVASMDWSSKASVWAGMVAIVVAIVKWLDGNAKNEVAEIHAQVALAPPPPPPVSARKTRAKNPVT